MIESRLQASGRITIPPAVRAALGLRPGDTVRYEIEGDQVSLSRVGRAADAGEPFTDAELQPIIDAALDEADRDEGIPLDDVMAMLHARIDELASRSDAA